MLEWNVACSAFGVIDSSTALLGKFPPSNYILTIHYNFNKKKIMCSTSHQLTLFLQVTLTRYFVSGHSDNCTIDDSVKRLPISPPPDTSQLMRHWFGVFNASQAMSTSTSESCCNIETVCNIQVSWIGLLIFDDCCVCACNCCCCCCCNWRLSTFAAVVGTVVVVLVVVTCTVAGGVTQLI